MKKIFIASLALLISLGLVTGCGKKKTDEDKTVEGNKIETNTSEGIIKDQQLGTLTFTNTSLVRENGQTTLTTKVTNTGSETVTVSTFNMVFKNKDGEIITTLVGYVGGEVPAGEYRIIQSGTEYDLSLAKTVEYSINE